MIRLFCGHDEREAIGYHVFVQSVHRRGSESVAMHALTSRGMPVGTNAFTYSRFLVPWLCSFDGHAIFCDASDMLMLGDIAELDALFDPSFAVQVVRHEPYKTRHPIKYVGTSLQSPNVNYARKNWASVMLMNCAHDAWRAFTPNHIAAAEGVSLLQFAWLPDDHIGGLPPEWNRLVDEGQETVGAKIMHWTAGIPAFPHYAAAPGADRWRRERDRMLEIA